MNIIFLDVDGVLNSDDWYESPTAEKIRGDISSLVKQRTIEGLEIHSREYHRRDIDPSAVKNLQYIVDNTEAKIVVSSTWRYGATWDVLLFLLDKLGFTGEIVGRTPRGHHDYCCRGDVILGWVAEHQKQLGDYREYKNYVILDDNSGMLLCQKDNFVRTDWKTGLTMEDAKRAIKILNQ